MWTPFGPFLEFCLLEQVVDELDWFNGDLRWRSSAAAMPGRGPALLFLEASQRRAAASHQAHYANPRFDF
jgi:hypothetical protein